MKIDQLLLHVLHFVGILTLNGAKILDDGGALRVVPFESFRRLATMLSPSPFLRPRDMLHLYFIGDMIDGVRKLRILLSALQHLAVQ